MLYIFDWDGTLSDSLDRISNSLERAFEEVGLDVFDVEKRKSVVGLGLEEAFLALHPDLDNHQLQRLAQAYRSHYLALDTEFPSPLFEGAMSVLNSLKKDGHKLAVATGKTRRGLDRIFNHMHLENFFDSSRCADETCSKPHPLMLEEILAETKSSAEDSVMVGDTDFDVLMARHAGVGAVAVTYGAHPLERLTKAGPHRLIDRLEELLD